MHKKMPGKAGIFKTIIAGKTIPSESFQETW